MFWVIFYDSLTNKAYDHYTTELMVNQNGCYLHTGQPELKPYSSTVPYNYSRFQVVYKEGKVRW